VVQRSITAQSKKWHLLNALIPILLNRFTKRRDWATPIPTVWLDVESIHIGFRQACSLRARWQRLKLVPILPQFGND
jgi:hypothetical protein